MRATARREFYGRHISQLASHLPPLPPYEEWPKHLPANAPGRDPAGMIRPWLYNVDTQFETLKKFGLGEDDGTPKTVIEIYPGE